MSKDQIKEMAKHCHFYKEGKCLLLEEDAEECDMNCDMCKFAKTLYNAGYRKNEWISVEERLPEDVYGKDRKQITVLVCTKSGRVSTSSRVRMMQCNRETWELEYTDVFE